MVRREKRTFIGGGWVGGWEGVPGFDPAGRGSQSRHKDKAPGCAGMARKQDNTLRCQIALGDIMEATMTAHL